MFLTAGRVQHGCNTISQAVGITYDFIRRPDKQSACHWRGVGVLGIEPLELVGLEREGIRAATSAPMSASEAGASIPGRKPVQKRRPRSAITSGRQLFNCGNPNSSWARRYHDLRGHYVHDISCGRGRDALTQAQAALIDRVVSLQCELERLDALMSCGELVDLNEYGRATSHFRRVLETLGVERRILPINQSPDDYIAQVAAEEEPAIDAEIIEEEPAT